MTDRNHLQQRVAQRHQIQHLITQQQMQPVEQVDPATPPAADAVVIDVPAATPPAPEPAPQAGDNIFTQADVEAAIEKARQQEKDKLYGRLGKMEETLTQYETAQQAAEAERRAEQEAADAERKRLEEDELSAKDLLLKKEDEFNQRLNTAQNEWEQKFLALQEEAAAKDAVIERERQFQELTSYRDRRLAEEQENIMEELRDLVTGNTIEEIDASISRAIDKTSAIVGNIQQALGNQPQRLRGVPATGAPSTGPLENATEQQTLTAADIANMSIEEYAQVRDRLLAVGSRR